MGRIITPVKLQNFVDPDKAIIVDALVDTGASYVTLPLAWKERFGKFAEEEEVELQTATQEIITGTLCGPAKIGIGNFRPVRNDILFMEMEPNYGPQRNDYEPLLGHIPLQQCGAAVDMLGHRLVPVRYMDLKAARR